MEESTVWVVFNDGNRSFHKAEKFGQLANVVVAPYDKHFRNPKAIPDHVREVMAGYKDRDYLLMVGEPLLCGLVITVAREKSETGRLNILRWDKIEMGYEAVELDMAALPPIKTQREMLADAAEREQEEVLEEERETQDDFNI